MHSVTPPDVVPSPGRRRTKQSSNSTFGPLLGALTLIALLMPLNRLWVVQLFLVPCLLIVPGVILLRAIRVPGETVSSFFIYIPCASMVVLMASGLAVDLVGLLAGIKAPLRPLPLLAGLEITCLALLLSTVKCSRDVQIPWNSLRPTQLTWPFIIPIVAIIGALRLNNGHSNSIVIAMLCGCFVMLIGGVLISARIDDKVLSIILYAADLALTLNYSLRSDLIYGFDIATEYYDLHQTVVSGIWHTGHTDDAYGSMLTVTIMPAELHFLSGVPLLLVFKVIYPTITALFPVAIYYFGRNILSRTWAFIAAAFFVVQDSFADVLAELARQEIALVIFACLIAAVLDKKMDSRPRWLLVALFSLAMVVSHYSTTYIAITLLGLVIVIQWAASWIRAIPRITGVIVLAFALSTAGATVWYEVVTHSAISGVRQVAQSLQAQGLNVMPNRTPGENLITAYLNANTSTPMSAIEYQRLVHAYYEEHEPYIIPLPNAALPKYNLQDTVIPTAPIRLKLGYTAVELISVLVQQIAYALAAVGASIMVLRRTATVFTRQIGILGLATLIFLVLIRISGTLAVAYNQNRALLQAMPILAIPICWSLQSFVGQRKHRNDVTRVLATASLASLFISSSGLLGVVLGGGVAANLANNGEDYERFYMTSPELASAQWLGAEVHHGQLVYADRYAQLPLVAMTGIDGYSSSLVGDVTPLTLNQHAWVYASQTNTVDMLAQALFDNRTLTYVYPYKFLNANYNLVYNNGSSEVFNR